MKGDNKIIKGALSLGMGAFFSKLLGAVYRIFLTFIVGGYGLGLYQMIFPVYTLLLDFSGAGIPSALSKIISAKDEIDREKQAKIYLSVAIKILLVLGALFSILMILLSKIISRAQGNIDGYLGYIFLSPSVFLVCIISCYRGYFQGKMKMNPTAISQVIEQSVKLIFGVALAYIFRYNTVYSVAGATFAITLSEIVALLYLYALYRRQGGAREPKIVLSREEFLIKAKEIIKITVPITLIGVMLPLSHVIDSFVTVNVLSKYEQSPTALYGLLSGVACTIIGLPVSVCYGISSVAIPSVSSVKTEEEKQDKGVKSILLTTLVAFLSYIITFLLAKPIVSILFSRLSVTEKQISVALLRLTSPSILLLSLAQTTNAVLIGKGKLYFPIISMGVGIIIKTALGIILMSNPRLSVMGGGIALIACYFFVCLINLIMIFHKKVNRENKGAYNRQYAG